MRPAASLDTLPSIVRPPARPEFGLSADDAHSGKSCPRTAVECVFIGVGEEEEAHVRWRIGEVGWALRPVVRVVDGAGVRGWLPRRGDTDRRREGSARVLRHLGREFRVLQRIARPSLHFLLPVVSRGALRGAAPGGGRRRRSLYGDAGWWGVVHHPPVRWQYRRDHAPRYSAEVRQLRS